MKKYITAFLSLLLCLSFRVNTLAAPGTLEPEPGDYRNITGWLILIGAAVAVILLITLVLLIIKAIKKRKK